MTWREAHCKFLHDILVVLLMKTYHHENYLAFVIIQPGVKIDDYWEPGKAQLSDPTKFLESLFKYDKDNISEESIKKIQPYIDNDDFQPAAIAKVRT